MRFVTINLACDWLNCETVAPEGEGIVEELTIALDKKAAKTVGVCKQHRDELMMILEPMLAKGVTDPAKTPVKRSSAAVVPPAGGTVAADVMTACRVPDCLQPTKGNVGLAQHLKKKHDLTIAQHDELYPTG
jgi:hypothetical protein